MDMHGVRKIIYENGSCEIFEGFYDTIIGDFTNIFEMEPTPPEGYEYEIRDWNGYQRKVGERFTKLLEDRLEARKEMNDSSSSEILTDLDFVGIYSPQEYNFTTDKVDIVMAVNIDGLEEYCFRTNRAKFDAYLHDNYTSRDGFWSFIFNNVQDFEIETEQEAESFLNRNIRVMIDFYLLQEIDFEDLREDLYEGLFEIQRDHCCLYNQKDGCLYDYAVEYNSDEQDETVIVREKIDD